MTHGPSRAMLAREALPDEMERVYLMGFDVWGEDLSQVAYLELCRRSTKYRKGRWHVLTVEGEVVSSLIAYRDEFGLPPGCYGSGSIATPSVLRDRGPA